MSEMQEILQLKISVRNLVEFILRSGDLDNRKGGRGDVDAMQEGSRIHKKIQKRMGSNYSPEFSLSYTRQMEREGVTFNLCIEGRADGVISDIDMSPSITIDEIKGVYMEISHLEKAIPVHRAQAMCYAYIYANLYDQEEIGIRLTYCNMETENLKYFDEIFQREELEVWFVNLTDEYAKWAVWQIKWNKERNESIRKLEFPYTYRPEQKNLVTDVYKTILRNKRLFLEAPTGVGKTLSTVYPAIKAMGEGLSGKLFYLTAKTITRTVAEEAIRHLTEKGLSIKSITLTAKDKICILDKPDCNPVACPRAKGHYNRVNNAVYDLLSNENDISRDFILEYSMKHEVCPFEMALDVTNWADHIICDYNYVFDPNVYLRRFFLGDKKNDYVFLIDEAHNLVDRAREMYSAVLCKGDFLKIKKLVKNIDNALEKRLEVCNADMLKWKRDCDNYKILDNISDYVLHLMRLMTVFDEFLTDRLDQTLEGKDEILTLYMNIRHFLNMYEIYNEKYITYNDYNEEGDFFVKLLNMDPSDNLKKCLDKGRSAVFFSATLLPIGYYKEQLGGREEDYAVYAPSPFDVKNRIIMIGKDVSTRYTNRTQEEYEKIVEYIRIFIAAKKGNYMVFFPSYQMLNQVATLAEEVLEGLVIQTNIMTEAEKETFLLDFTYDPERTRVAFCVLGGIFSEGIDLKSDRLIGAVIVGTGLPMVCNEKDIFRVYYDKKNGMGFAYAYLYQGMNKVLQSAGRVIRTTEDKGSILLLEDRFLKSQYVELFPREWYPNVTVDKDIMEEELNKFWSDNAT
ncbi:MAG: ATP-dependent DNA helicase [Anaerocolumna sp.]